MWAIASSSICLTDLTGSIEMNGDQTPLEQLDTTLPRTTTSKVKAKSLHNNMAHIFLYSFLPVAFLVASILSTYQLLAWKKGRKIVKHTSRDHFGGNVVNRQCMQQLSQIMRASQNKININDTGFKNFYARKYLHYISFGICSTWIFPKLFY